MALVATHKKTIDGTTYSTSTLPATEGLIMMARLGRLIDTSMVGKALLQLDTDDDSILTNPALILDLVGHMLDVVLWVGRASFSEP